MEESGGKNFKKIFLKKMIKANSNNPQQLQTLSVSNSRCSKASTSNTPNQKNMKGPALRNGGLSPPTVAQLGPHLQKFYTQGNNNNSASLSASREMP
jgi:hypothetical protein